MVVIFNVIMVDLTFIEKKRIIRYFVKELITY